MDFAAEWKSLWPISSAFSPPLLLSNKNSKTDLGPLIFTPNQNTPSTPLLHSPTLSPHLFPPYPNLLLPQFLQKYNSTSSSAASISSLLDPHISNYSSHLHSFNSLQLLRVQDKNLIIVFFPTGENSDQVGFSLLAVKNGTLSVHSQRENYIQLAKEGCVSRQRITRLLVNPFDDFCSDNEFVDVSSDNQRESKNVVRIVVGFLMVCTTYSVYWYRVGVSRVSREIEYSVFLDYAGCVDGKMLKRNLVMSACWSPHLREECLVLLENGNVLLFDVHCSCEEKDKLVNLVRGNNRVVRKKMHVSLNDKVRLKKEGDGGEGVWFQCEFSWHPRVFIAAHSNAVFLVDLRSAEECNICCLVKIEMLSMVKNDGFLALSRVDSDEFYFTVASRQLLILVDIRQPLMPALRWAHDIRNPCYMTVIRLSDLRANAEDNKYNWASESGYCIMLGSFWDSEYNLFCYGPGGKGNESISSGISKFCNLYYAWDLPSDILLSGNDCNCGSCLVREEFSKASLPVWIDWRQKKDLVLGFNILDADMSAQISAPDSFGGFTLIRLMSSGKLEAQQYVTSWESKKHSEVGQKRKSTDLKDGLLHDRADLEYDGEKKFYHLKLDYLNAYLKDNLATYIVKRRGKKTESGEDVQKKYPFKLDSSFHREICQRLKDFGLPRVRSSLTVSDLLKDISLPSSIHEVALRSIWAALPTYLLQLGFSTYFDFHENLENHKEPLEFSVIPDQLQVPPFSFKKPSCRSNKWSSKVQPYDTLVGPVLPPHVLTTLHKLNMEEVKMEKELYVEETKEFSVQSQFNLQCDKVMEVVDKHVLGSDTGTQDDEFVSLADDTDCVNYGKQKLKLSYHKPLAFSKNVGRRKSGCENDIFSTHVFRSQELASDLSAEIVGQELFDVGCPIELKFGDCTINFGPTELEAYQNLKKRELDFQKKFQPYQDYINRGNGMK